MNSNKLITVVMTLKDYEIWTLNKDSFVRVHIHGNGVITYSMETYDELWEECQLSLDDDTLIILEQLEGEPYYDMKADLMSDFLMRSDAYSYENYKESDSFVPSISLNQIGFQYFYSLVFGDYRDND